MLTLITGIVLGIFGMAAVQILLAALEMRKVRKAIVLGNVDKKKLCKGMHSWIDAKMAGGQGVAPVKVCQMCGFISGTNKMATQDMIDRVEEQNRLFEIEEKLLEEFMKFEEKQVQAFFHEELKNGFNFDKLIQLHAAGQTFNERFMIFKEHKTQEIRDSETKGAHDC